MEGAVAAEVGEQVAGVAVEQWVEGARVTAFSMVEERGRQVVDILRLARRGGLLVCHVCDQEVATIDALHRHYEALHGHLMPHLAGLEELGPNNEGEEVTLEVEPEEQEGEEVEYEVEEEEEKPVKKFPCIVCKRKFVEKIEMKEHVREEHFAPVVRCEQCGGRVKKRDLEEHIEVHHPDL